MTDQQPGRHAVDTAQSKQAQISIMSNIAQKILLFLATLLAAGGLSAQAGNKVVINWAPVRAAAPLGPFEIARTETTVGQFREFVRATQWVTRAERLGGGQVYEAGWVQKPGWYWARPFGRPAQDNEPAVHVDVEDARAFCRWAGGDLPTDAQWAAAAYTEWRPMPPAPFKTGQRYRYPTGDSPQGAQCLGDCGANAQARAVASAMGLWRGHGHALVGQTPAGVNGLFDMGANAWEWTRPDSANSLGNSDSQWRTRGGSWWYGSEPMLENHVAYKPMQTTVVYIGFRCARPPQ